MGFQMAKNLRATLAVHDHLWVFDINDSSIERLVGETPSRDGARIVVARCAKEVAEQSETTVTVLPETAHVRDVYRQMMQAPQYDGQHSQDHDRLFIDCSTIDPISSKEIGHAVHRSTLGELVDAPMSGGVAGATAGTLTFMLGAPDHLVGRCEELLRRMGQKVWHCGPPGAGLAGKLANNYLLAINNIATAEAMNLGIQWGLDPKLLSNLINSSTGRCWPSEVNNPVRGVVPTAPASRDYHGGFSVGLMKKDLNLAMLGAAQAGARLELADKALQVYETVHARETGSGRDFSVVYSYLTENKK
ncbi:hypothetical protein K3495_g9826 [Podosphaera aphanis]|nr:hypothetical protein K3495_g9826 [Podosphaera aphanis]